MWLHVKDRRSQPCRKFQTVVLMAYGRNVHSHPDRTNNPSFNINVCSLQKGALKSVLIGHPYIDANSLLLRPKRNCKSPPTRSIQTASTIMSLPSKHLPDRSISSQSIPLLPAKAYVPPPSAQTSPESCNPLIDAHVGQPAMPSEDEIKDVATTSRSSGTITTSSCASNNHGEKKGFPPLFDVKE